MVLRCFNVLKVIADRRLHKYICKMNKAYLRHSDDTGRFEFTFQYVDQERKINRQFNFSRLASESVVSFSQRVSVNIEKVLKKKSKNHEQNVQVSVQVNGNLVQDEKVLCGDIFQASANKNVTLNVGNQEYSVIVNSPWISGLTLPTSILAGFPVYPAKFESVYTDRQLSEFTWYKSVDKIKWDFVGGGFIYNTSNCDVGNYLKLHCIPKNENLEGPTAETISSTVVEAGPGFCPFETRHKFTQGRCEGDMFRVVSYNILADLYCDSDFTREVLHPYCPAYALSIDYRKQFFIKEITGYNADLICLQEVDRKIYHHDLQPLFQQLGYESDFCIKRGQVAEGVALFYDFRKFKRLETYRLVLSDEINNNPLFTDIWAKIEENRQLSERFLDRSSVLQVNILESLTSNEILVVGNTHLYFHPDADHIRLLQGGMIIRYLEDILNKFGAKSKKRVSLILSGDFNSVPECGIYQLYTTGSVQEDHKDFQSKPEEAIQVPLHTSLQLQSACGTPKYTNFTAGFADCLDYIYYDPRNIEVIQVVPFPSPEELKQNTALPSVVFPSDHIALISDLKWNKR